MCITNCVFVSTPCLTFIIQFVIIKTEFSKFINPTEQWLLFFQPVRIFRNMCLKLTLNQSDISGSATKLKTANTSDIYRCMISWKEETTVREKIALLFLKLCLNPRKLNSIYLNQRLFWNIYVLIGFFWFVLLNEWVRFKQSNLAWLFYP